MPSEVALLLEENRKLRQELVVLGRKRDLAVKALEMMRDAAMGNITVQGLWAKVNELMGDVEEMKKEELKSL